MPQDLTAARLRKPAHVIVREFPAETVLLNIQTGQYHGLDPVAGRMFTALDSSGEVAGAVALLIPVFDEVEPDRLAADLERFCDDLLARGLLERA